MHLCHFKFIMKTSGSYHKGLDADEKLSRDSVIDNTSNEYLGCRYIVMYLLYRYSKLEYFATRWSKTRGALVMTAEAKPRIGGSGLGERHVKL